MRPQDLDRAARGELRTLSKENADAVARHLVMAARLIDEAPTEALRHALAAGRRAGRVAVVRESVAIAAYATGDFALALRELRTFRRISGSDDQIALMVDSERGVGRPDRALELGRSVDRAALPVVAQVGLAIAMSGARLDLGDTAAALDELERAPVDLQRAHPWSSSLFIAFAAVLDDVGDREEADRWRSRAAIADRVLADAAGEQDEVEVEERDVDEDPDDGGPVEGSAGPDGEGAESAGPDGEGSESAGPESASPDGEVPDGAAPVADGPVADGPGGDGPSREGTAGEAPIADGPGGDGPSREGTAGGAATDAGPAPTGP